MKLNDIKIGAIVSLSSTEGFDIFTPISSLVLKEEDKSVWLLVSMPDEKLDCNSAVSLVRSSGGIERRTPIGRIGSSPSVLKEPYSRLFLPILLDPKFVRLAPGADTPDHFKQVAIIRNIFRDSVNGNPTRIKAFIKGEWPDLVFGTNLPINSEHRYRHQRGLVIGDIFNSELEAKGDAIVLPKAVRATATKCSSLDEKLEDGAAALSVNRSLLGFVIGHAPGDHILILPAETLSEECGLRFISSGSDSLRCSPVP
jgi:hypothetical protein